MAREVMIKAVRTGSLESQILWRLASPPLRDSPGNHTIPVVSIQDCNGTTFLVQARWGCCDYHYDVPTVAFWAGTQLYQLLEGLTFMHEHGVAHGVGQPTTSILCAT